MFTKEDVEITVLRCNAKQNQVKKVIFGQKQYHEMSHLSSMSSSSSVDGDRNRRTLEQCLLKLFSFQIDKNNMCKTTTQFDGFINFELHLCNPSHAQIICSVNLIHSVFPKVNAYIQDFRIAHKYINENRRYKENFHHINQ